MRLLDVDTMTPGAIIVRMRHYHMQRMCTKSIRLLRKAVHAERGFSLLEVVIAICLLGILASGFVPALSTAARTMVTVDERETAKNLAEREMEWVRTQLYASTYEDNSYVTDYPGLTVTITTAETIAGRDDHNIQEVTIVVSRGGQEITRLVDFKIRE